MENPNPVDPGVPPKEAPDDGSNPSPPPGKPEVTPLDPDKNLEKGITVNET